ncbi:MAG: DUF364 domain-containing protein [Clostridium sp.]
MEFYIEVRNRFLEVIDKYNIDMNKSVTIKALTPVNAIGIPDRFDYPILKGKELLVDADFQGSIGQAYTSNPCSYVGTLREVVNLDISIDKNIPILVATINAVLKNLGIVDRTIHCKNEEPKNCSFDILSFFKENYKGKNIGLVGLQPAMLSVLSREFKLRVLDLDVDNVGKFKDGVLIENGEESFDDVVNWADVLLVTGSCCANKTLKNFIMDKEVYFYGTSIAGIAYLMNLKRLCYLAK